MNHCLFDELRTDSCDYKYRESMQWYSVFDIVPFTVGHR